MSFALPRNILDQKKKKKKGKRKMADGSIAVTKISAGLESTSPTLLAEHFHMFEGKQWASD